MRGNGVFFRDPNGHEVRALTTDEAARASDWPDMCRGCDYPLDACQCEEIRNHGSGRAFDDTFLVEEAPTRAHSDESVGGYVVPEDVAAFLRQGFEWINSPDAHPTCQHSL